ncbi:5-oxoprolinase subunit C family protein [Thalassotalea fusca]
MNRDRGKQPIISIEHLMGYATLQDLGREHAQHLGFSASGAADLHAAAYANLLLGNSASAPVIELALAETTLVSSIDIELSITGANCQVFIGGKTKRQWHKLSLAAGQKLSISRPTTGVYVYIALQHRIASPEFLESVSPVPDAMNEAVEIHPLKSGHSLTLTPIDDEQRIELGSIYQPVPTNFYAFDQLTLRFIPCDLWRHLGESEQNIILSQSYEITRNSNKMGYRLNGMPLPLSASHFQQLSRPCAFGTIQISSDGLPIILMKERQTIGGYPIIGHVMQTDLFRLAQLTAGAKVTFRPVSLSFAQQQLHMLYQRLNITN